MITVTIVSFVVFMIFWLTIGTIVTDLIFGYFSKVEKYLPFIGIVLYIVMWLESNQYF